MHGWSMKEFGPRIHLLQQGCGGGQWKKLSSLAIQSARSNHPLPTAMLLIITARVVRTDFSPRKFEALHGARAERVVLVSLE
eukprot:1126862-Prymnesium_polylepis.1